jgi:hypothetical protein
MEKYNLSRSANRSKRAIYRLDPVGKKFYTYCLFYSCDKTNDVFDATKVFYIGKATNTQILAFRREREHIRDAYSKHYELYHRSRKIRLLEESGNYIMSKVLYETDCENDAYTSEIEWYDFFSKTNDLTNMVPCGKGTGSGLSHPGYNPLLRLHSAEIIKLYNETFWSMQRICRHFVKKILFEDASVPQHPKDYRGDMRQNTADISLQYKNGVAAYKIAKQYKCSSNLILTILKENNIEIKGMHPQMKSSTAWGSKELIVEDYKSGISMTLLAKKYKCDIKCTIIPILQEANIDTCKGRHPAWEFQEEIRELKHKGYTCVALAKKYTVSVQLIYKILS